MADLPLIVFDLFAEAALTEAAIWRTAVGGRRSAMKEPVPGAAHRCAGAGEKCCHGGGEPVMSSLVTADVDSVWLPLEPMPVSRLLRSVAAESHATPSPRVPARVVGKQQCADRSLARLHV
jgi:hypothetical protein